jgi:hypothetical protein
VAHLSLRGGSDQFGCHVETLLREASLLSFRMPSSGLLV